jgi:hypothetical protein
VEVGVGGGWVAVSSTASVAVGVAGGLVSVAWISGTSVGNGVGDGVGEAAGAWVGGWVGGAVSWSTSGGGEVVPSPAQALIARARVRVSRRDRYFFMVFSP